MNGTYKRSRNYRSLALSVLGGLGLAAFAVSALAQGAGGKGVSVTVNPTTGYSVINSSTVSTPRGTTIGPSGGPPSVTVRPGGGLSQSLPAGIEITGVRQNAQTLRGPLGVNLNATASALKNAAVRCLTSFRCNLLLTGGAIGLQSLLDGIDWVMDEGGRISESVTSFEEPEIPGNVLFTTGWNMWQEPGYIRVGHYNNRDWYCAARAEQWAGGPRYPLCSIQQNRCSYCNDGTSGLVEELVPLSHSDIADGVDQHYSPQPSDWNWLTGGLNFSDPGVTVEITDIPVLDGSNEPNFIEWSDGTSRGTFNIYTPTVKNNNSQKPEIEVNDQQTEITYDEQGNPTGTSTSTSTLTPNPGGSPSSPDINIPTDCDFMPTVCRFIDWFTEPDPSPDPDQEIRDLVQVYEDGGREVDVGPSTGSCPPPRVVALSFVPAVEVSFQPFCDLAAAVRYWLLAIAYFGAAYLTVRSI